MYIRVVGDTRTIYTRKNSRMRVHKRKKYGKKEYNYKMGLNLGEKQIFTGVHCFCRNRLLGQMKK